MPVNQPPSQRAQTSNPQPTSRGGSGPFTGGWSGSAKRASNVAYASSIAIQIAARDHRKTSRAVRRRGIVGGSSPIVRDVMAYEFTLPDLGEGLTEGEIARWLVAEGDEIAEDQPLLEITTDKATVEIPSPAGGKVAPILVGEGEVVPVGTLLVVIGAEAAPRAAPQATPAVRQLAKEAGVDLGLVRGTGPSG